MSFSCFFFNHFRASQEQLLKLGVTGERGISGVGHILGFFRPQTFGFLLNQLVFMVSVLCVKPCG